MKYRYDSPCGLYCGSCGSLLATMEGKIEERAKEWGMKPEDVVCHGCLSEHTASFCNACEFKDCAKAKGIEYCFECNEYPCQKLKDFQGDEWPHHSLVFKNCDRLKEVGVKQWLAEQKERWKCSSCEKTFMWYDEKCSGCGGDVYNAKDEAEDLG